MSETTTTIPPTIGQPWPEQGGIFIGSRLIDGQVHHIITPAGIEHDRRADFDQIEAGGVEFGDINGHSDWQVGEQEDLMLAWVTAREHFVQTGGLDSIYWSRSFHHGWPWAVGFEYGYVYYRYRDLVFRVRPFRSVIASSL
ncbi:DUF1566 domain-containing protein [Pseudothauera rhizosphaerae]|uniref:DUF1566 domain-containing protein n=1 Tax=Pseudothauera rhizosphaerae TaxID=2565932 RepID=A0A4S4AAJ9_9RHOO|nr:DUF1566 domain-containing protein [Pseudothauera rhizosphaerae]THF55944.1 DUF1566 domain-containing protein [Pseudothauera rhizosphaerae]